MASWKSIGQEGNQNCRAEVCFLIPTWWVFLSSIWRVSSTVPNTRDGREPLRITKTIFTSLATCRTLFTYYNIRNGRKIRTVFTRGLLLELISTYTGFRLYGLRRYGMVFLALFQLYGHILVLSFSNIWSFWLYGQLYQDKTVDHISETRCITRVQGTSSAKYENFTHLRGIRVAGTCLADEEEENLCMRSSERVTSDWQTTATLFAVCLFGDPDHRDDILIARANQPSHDTDHREVPHFDIWSLAWIPKALWKIYWCNISPGYQGVQATSCKH